MDTILIRNQHIKTPVIFPIAKLLKEKGFDKPIQHTIAGINYVYDGYTQDFVKYVSTDAVENWNAEKYDGLFSAPTIAEVKMWLYERYNVWISVFPTDDLTMFSYKISSTQGHYYSPNFPSPTEAYEAGIKYTLENLL